jgi:hypothetical protein
LGLATVGTAAANPGQGSGSSNGKQFGAVYANDRLYRTNVVKVLDEAPQPNDDIYFFHDGEGSLLAREDVSAAQQSPFVSATGPGDKGWTGGQWVHYNAEVTNVEAFNADAPLDDTDEFVGDTPTESTKSYLELERGRPTRTTDDGDDVPFGPPAFFICPLNGRA